jgi:hypothetical protein
MIYCLLVDGAGEEGCSSARGLHDPYEATLAVLKSDGIPISSEGGYK